MEDSPQFNQSRTPIYSESPASPSYLSSNSPHSRRRSNGLNQEGSGLESDEESQSHQNGSTDSLLNASFTEVEARALELLESTIPEEDPTYLIGIGSKNYSNSIIIDLPRPALNATSSEGEVQYQSSLAYLQSCVAELDETDWIFETKNHEDQKEKIGGLGSNVEEVESSWQDEAFNLESYPGLEEEDGIGQAMKFMDLGSNGMMARQ